MGMRTNSWTELVRLGWSGKDKLDFLLRILMDWSRFLGRKNKLLQASSRSRSYGALWMTDVLILRLCCSRADAFEHVLLRLLPRLAALAVHQLALERLEEGFRERVVPQVARP